MLHLILFGKSGTGKSSTGNSILGQEVFSISESTVENSYSSPLKKRDITSTFSIIDGFDVLFCGENAYFDNIVQDLQLSDEGITAFLFIVKYGERFYEEHYKVVEMTKKIFGNNVFKKFGICVLTCGDRFKDENKRDGQLQSVIDWIKKQTGLLRDLYEECNQRCVLFDNRTSIGKEKTKQVQKLKEIVRQIKNCNNGNYTMHDFKEAKPLREDLTMEKELIKEKTKCDVLIKDTITQSKNAVESNDREKLLSLQQELKKRLQEFKKTFHTQSTHEVDIKRKLEIAISDVECKIKFLEKSSCLQQQQNTNVNTVCPSYRTAPDLKKTSTTQAPSQANTNLLSSFTFPYMYMGTLFGTNSVAKPSKQMDSEHQNSSTKVQRLEKDINALEGVLMSNYQQFLEVPRTIDNRSKYDEVQHKLQFFENYKKPKLADEKKTTSICPSVFTY